MTSNGSEDDRPKRGPDPRLKTESTLVAIPGVAVGGSARLLNLSTGGACVEVDVELEQGQSLELKFAHPQLRVVPVVTGEVMWVEGAGAATRAGLRFMDSSQADSAVRPILTAEAGSCLFQEERLVGFVVPHGKANKAWSLFDETGKRLAVAALKGDAYEVQAKTQRAGSLPSFRTSSLFEATRMSIGVEEPLRLEPLLPDWRTVLGAVADPAADPALDDPSLEPTSRDATGRVVSGPAGPLGYLCDTVVPDSWLAVDLEGKQVAYFAGSGSEFQICSMGDAIDDELEFRAFPDLEHAVAVAFRLGDTACVELGELQVVGQVSPVRVKDSESSVDLDLNHGALQVTMTGYASLKGPPPRRATPTLDLTGTKPRQQSKKTRYKQLTKKDEARRAGSFVALLAGAALLAYLLYSLWTLVMTYTS